MLQKLIAKELSYFHNLNQNARKLISSIFFFNLISPIFYIFLNAFLWRQSHNIVLVATYNAILFAVVPFGFYLNGIILRKYTPALPYTISLLIQGLATALLMFVPSISYLTVTFFSIVYGVSGGVYWANRNLLTLKTTTTHDRIYFSSIEIASNNATDVIIPLLIGWFITFGTFTHIYSPLQGYQLLVLYMIAIIILIGLISKTIDTTAISVPTLRVKNVSEKWKKFRMVEFALGLREAVVTFIPVLLVLTLIGKEDALGTVQSASAILASLLIYKLGKSLKTTHRIKLLATYVTITFIGALLFGLLYTAIGVLIFIASQALAEPFSWVSVQSINYDLIDEDNKDPNQHYAYVCDQEIYLNWGRSIGILLFLGLLVLTSNSFALRFSPLIFTISQISLFFIAKSLEKNA